MPDWRYFLHIKKLRCALPLEEEDDELDVDIKIDGYLKDRLHYPDVKVNHVININKYYEFKNFAKVELWDTDRGSYLGVKYDEDEEDHEDPFRPERDYIGRVNVSSYRTFEYVTEKIQKDYDALYELTYKVIQEKKDDPSAKFKPHHIQRKRGSNVKLRPKPVRRQPTPKVKKGLRRGIKL